MRAFWASIIVWATVIMAAAAVAPEAFGKLIPVLGGGVAAHIIVLGAGLRRGQPAVQGKAKKSGRR